MAWRENSNHAARFAAYKRHLRKGEPVCDDCQRAAREQKNERVDGDRDARKLSSLMPDVSFDAAERDDFDPLEDAKDNLRVVKAALRDAVPREVAALSKRRQELVALIAELGNVGKEVSIADQLAEKREQRRRAGASA